MKKIILGVILVTLTFSSESQNLIGTSRRTIVPLVLTEYSMVSSTIKTLTAPLVGNLTKNIPVKSNFTIINDFNSGGVDYYVIYLWNWTAGSTNYNNLNFDAGAAEQRYFLILKRNIDTWSEKIYNLWSPSVGTLTLPFKYRPQNKKFEKTFALSTCGGVKWNPFRTNEHTFSLLLGVGASSVTVSQYNTAVEAGITEASDRAAVTISLNLMYEWNNLQIGISLGVDNIFDNESVKWNHQGNPWFSIGVGVSLFSKSEITSPGSND